MLEMETSRHFTTNRTPSLTSTFITVQTITSDRGVPSRLAGQRAESDRDNHKLLRYAHQCLIAFIILRHRNHYGRNKNCNYFSLVQLRIF